MLSKVKTLSVSSFEDGWRETKGIKWKIVRSKTNYVLQVLVICPLCGRVGTLWRSNRRKGSGFWIVHDRSKKDACHIGWSLEEHDALKEIYEYRLKIENTIRF